ncbi:MAG TPA: DUF998 domain-containing protein [Marmoricola sp.]|nr:DUF998 domain-containing protein [Marmoricola sp.]
MTTTRPSDSRELDTPAAVTRSMLGWGVLAGPIYLVTGITLALTRDGFDLTEHALSLLMLGDGGWMQRTNLLLSGLLCLVAAIGISRAVAYDSTHTRAGALVAVFGVGMLGSGAFAPDPMHGFPAGMEEVVTASGILHMVFGLVQFLSLTAAGITLARWSSRRGDDRHSIGSRALALTALVGFLGGAALGQHPLGIALLWVAVLAAYGWIATTCLYLWGVVPHPDRTRR